MAQKKKKKHTHTNKCWHYYAWFHQTLQNLFLADFLKMDLMEFAVIWLKKGQKAGFVVLEKLENHTNQGKGKEKKKKQGRKKGGEEN